MIGLSKWTDRDDVKGSVFSLLILGGMGVLYETESDTNRMDSNQSRD